MADSSDQDSRWLSPMPPANDRPASFPIPALVGFLFRHLTRARDANRLASAKLADLTEDFILPFDLKDHIAPAILFGGDDVAHLKRKQLADAHGRAREIGSHFQRCVAYAALELPLMIVVPAFFLVAEPVLCRQHAHDRLDHVIRNAQA